MLDGDRIGTLRPGDRAPTWTTGVGQARNGFGYEALALGSTVICGGEPGRAYVGYWTYELEYVPGISQRTWIPGPGESNYTPERYAEYQKGDLDAVRLKPDGTVALEEHIWRTVGASNAGKQIGIHNTNDFHYDEDRSVFKCARVTRPPYRGDLYITTNHGVVMVQGLTYNSHRHAAWYIDINGEPTLQAPPVHALGIAPNGDVLIANEEMVGILVPDGKIEDWDRELTWEGPVPWKFKGFNNVLNDGLWRAFEQTASGLYYLGSAQYGVWAMKPNSHTGADWSKLAGLPTDAIISMQATDDGALYIGTDGAGLWRLEPDGVALGRVEHIAGERVLQLGYEPTVTPTMLLVLTERGLTVIRGP